MSDKMRTASKIDARSVQQHTKTSAGSGFQRSSSTANAGSSYNQVMHGLSLWAEPWWVNLLLLVPVLNLAVWRKRPLGIERSRLLFAGVFAAAFGFVEAAVVVYLRAALGIVPEAAVRMEDVNRIAQQMQLPASQLPPIIQNMMHVEVAREAATMIMLLSVAMLAARSLRDRWAAFLWMFAIWDILYYVGLWATVRWPASLLDVDILFLIPIPWVAQVWFPVLVSSLCMAAVVLGRRSKSADRAKSAAA